MKNHWLKINHVYVVDDGEQWWYVASSQADAQNRHCILCACAGLLGLVEITSITELSDDTLLAIRDEDDVVIEKTCLEWVSVGKGCIGSTVW